MMLRGIRPTSIQQTRLNQVGPAAFLNAPYRPLRKSVGLREAWCRVRVDPPHLPAGFRDGRVIVREEGLHLWAGRFLKRAHGVKRALVIEQHLRETFRPSGGSVKHDERV